MSPMLSLAAMLGAFWLMLSGHHTPLLLGVGAASVLLVAWLSQRIGIVDEETGRLYRNWRAPLHWLWIGRQSLWWASIVSRDIWSPRALPQACVATVRTPGLSDAERVAYANSITLVPGSLPISIHEDRLDMHAYSVDALRDLENDELVRRIQRMKLG